MLMILCSLVAACWALIRHAIAGPVAAFLSPITYGQPWLHALCLISWLLFQDTFHTLPVGGHLNAGAGGLRYSFMLSKCHGGTGCRKTLSMRERESAPPVEATVRSTAKASRGTDRRNRVQR